MKYIHKFISYDEIDCFTCHLHFSETELSKEDIQKLLKKYCSEWDEDDELFLHESSEFADGNIRSSTMKMYPEGMENDWFYCYCGYEEIK